MTNAIAVAKRKAALLAQREAEGRDCRKQERYDLVPFCALLPASIRTKGEEADAWLRGYNAEGP